MGLSDLFSNRNRKRLFESSVRSFIPRYTYVPFSDSTDSLGDTSLSSGDEVKEGQTIAISRGFSTEGANMHSSTPGKIDSIGTCTMPNGKIGNVVKIMTEGSFSYLGKSLKKSDWHSMSKNILLDTFKTKGVANSFDLEDVPLSTQIHECTLSTNRFLAVRMYDEDPSRVTDTFVAEKFSNEVIEGSLIIAKAFEARGIAFAVSKKSHVSADEFENINLPSIVVSVDSDDYPQGFRQNIIDAVKKASRNLENSEFNGINSQCLFIDPETALSAYEAVVFGVPVMERFVHVGGDCLNSVAMFKTRIGTPVSFLVEQCGGFKMKPQKIIINGINVGNSISTCDVPVTKSLKSVSFIPQSQISIQSVVPCIRCGKCRNVCPEKLLPDLYYKAIMENLHLSQEIRETTKLCIHCNLCNSVCPSRLSLSQAAMLLCGKDDKK